MGRKIAYLRVSTEEQADSGLGLEAQLQSITETFGEPDLIFSDEGVSGAKPHHKREGLMQTLATLKKGDKLLVRDVSRLSRSFDLTFYLRYRIRQEFKAELLDVEGKLTGNEIELQIEAMLAEQARQRIQKDTKAALARKRASGYKTGGDVPYGFTADSEGKLTACTKEQKVLNTISFLRSNAWTVKSICSHLESANIPTKTGGKVWHPTQVNRLLKCVI
jgi:site-specific DNA recombinase